MNLLDSSKQTFKQECKCLIHVLDLLDLLCRSGSWKPTEHQRKTQQHKDVNGYDNAGFLIASVGAVNRSDEALQPQSHIRYHRLNYFNFYGVSFTVLIFDGLALYLSS